MAVWQLGHPSGELVHPEGNWQGAVGATWSWPLFPSEESGWPVTVSGASGRQAFELNLKAQLPCRAVAALPTPRVPSDRTQPRGQARTIARQGPRTACTKYRSGVVRIFGQRSRQQQSRRSDR